MHEKHKVQIREFVRRLVPIPEAELEAFCQRATYRDVPTGTDLVHAGKVCHELWFIHEGTFRYYLLTHGQEYTKDFSPRQSLCTALTSLVTQTPSQIYLGALWA